MKHRTHTQRKHILVNMILPVLLYGGITGTVVGICIALFKFAASHVIAFSKNCYTYIGERLLAGNPFPLLGAVAALVLLAFLLSHLYRVMPNVRGGGIPSSIGIVRGVLSFRWIFNAPAVFLSSLASFLVGVPLGTEGPSVQLGTALASGVSTLTHKKHAAWNRYILTSGACAGFTAATGAPISGVLFAIEEAHQRISPMVFAVCATAVAAEQTVSNWISPILGVDVELFHHMHIPKLAASELWLAVLMGVWVGFMAVVFLRYYRDLSSVWRKKTAKIPSFIKIAFVFLLTLGLGLVAYPYISTGHGLIDTLLYGGGVWYILLSALFIRATLTILCSSNGITGGLFLPILALGALIAALLGRGIVAVFDMSTEYYPIIVVLGIVASIAGMMKMPITAMVFAVEVLSASENILPVIITAVLAYAVTEIFYVDSITEHVLEHRIEELHEGKKAEAYDAHLVLQAGAFAVGKQVRDILWPHGLVVLSFKRESGKNSEVDSYGEKILHVGDELHVRYSTYDHEATMRELVALVGEQRNGEEELEQI